MSFESVLVAALKFDKDALQLIIKTANIDEWKIGGLV